MFELRSVSHHVVQHGLPVSRANGSQISQMSVGFEAEKQKVAVKRHFSVVHKPPAYQVHKVQVAVAAFGVIHTFLNKRFVCRS